jgi:hypothetical protein
MQTGWIVSGAYTNLALTAKEDDGAVYLAPKSDDPYQRWVLANPIDGNCFVMYNARSKKVIYYTGGNGAELRMGFLDDPAIQGNGAFWSWGGMEGWGAKALQWYGDSGQNVDAGAQAPNQGPLHTRGWRDGDQRSLTWNFVPDPGVERGSKRAA